VVDGLAFLTPDISFVAARFREISYSDEPSGGGGQRNKINEAMLRLSWSTIIQKTPVYEQSERPAPAGRSLVT